MVSVWSDPQFYLVTLVAAVALGFLLRPFFKRGSSSGSSPGCESCARSPAEDAAPLVSLGGRKPTHGEPGS